MARKIRGLYSVHINNLPVDANAENLVEIFRGAGEVKQHYVESNPPVGRYTFGFMRYPTRQEAEEAIDLFDGITFEGRELKVSMARDQPGGPPRERRPNEQRPEKNSFDQERVKEVNDVLIRHGLIDDMPLLMKELRNVPYEQFPVETCPHADFAFDTGLIESLMRAKAREEKTLQSGSYSSVHSPGVSPTCVSPAAGDLNPTAEETELADLVKSLSEAFSAKTSQSQYEAHEGEGQLDSDRDSFSTSFGTRENLSTSRFQSAFEDTTKCFEENYAFSSQNDGYIEDADDHSRKSFSSGVKQRSHEPVYLDRVPFQSETTSSRRDIADHFAPNKTDFELNPTDSPFAQNTCSYVSSFHAEQQEVEVSQANHSGTRNVSEARSDTQPTCLQTDHAETLYNTDLRGGVHSCVKQDTSEDLPCDTNLKNYRQVESKQGAVGEVKAAGVKRLGIGRGKGLKLLGQQKP